MASEPWNDITTILGGYPGFDEIASELWGNYVQRNLERLYSPPGVCAVRSAPQPITGGTWTPVSFTGTDEWDTDSFHDPVSEPSILRVPVGLAGHYRVDAQVFWESGDGRRNLAIELNGSTDIYGRVDSNSSGGAQVIGAATSVELYLAEGDEIQAIVWHNSTTDPLDVATTAATTVNQTRCSLRWIGGQ